MNVGGFLDLKNSVNKAKWAWRWHQQNGSRFWVARNLTDLRDEDALRQWRRIETEVRQRRRYWKPIARIATARIRKMSRAS